MKKMTVQIQVPVQILILTQIRSSFKNHPLNFLRKNNQFFSKAEKILLYKKKIINRELKAVFLAEMMCF